MSCEPADTPATDWHVVASKRDLLEATLLEIHVGRSVIVLIGRDDEVHAFQGLCPHQMARLAEGTLVDGALQCPRHLARFDLRDGTCGGGWQLAALRRYAVRVDGDDVLLPDPLVRL